MNYRIQFSNLQEDQQHTVLHNQTGLNTGYTLKVSNLVIPQQNIRHHEREEITQLVYILDKYHTPKDSHIIIFS